MKTKHCHEKLSLCKELDEKHNMLMRISACFIQKVNLIISLPPTIYFDFQD